ncbi:hypothetical protein C8J56DRAFT_1139500 [Mycena floridula]|nr:hypothetical protein C8J56DRAFT_1139500 [Mycena floridula]
MDLVERRKLITRVIAFLLSSKRQSRKPDSCPVQQLPPEVIGDIFVMALTGDDGKMEAVAFPSNEKLQGPNIIASVCSRWRAIIISLPSLWCTIEITVHKDLVPTIALSSLRTAIQRTKGRPLDIRATFKLTKDHDSLSIARSDALLKEILGLSELWKSASFDVHEPMLPAFTVVHKHVPLLQELALRVPVYVVSRNLISSPWDYCFSVAPRLTSVTLEGFLHQWTHPEFPWPQITRYDAWDGIWEASNMLPDLHSVRYLRVGGMFNWRADSPDIIELGELKSLRLYPTNGTTSLDQFNAPNVRDVMLGIGSQNTRMIELTNFVKRSQCHLTSLTLCDVSPDTAILTELLDNVPTVTYLGITGSRWGTHSFSMLFRLSNVQTSRVRLPRLHRLSIEAIGGHWDLGVLASALRSRWKVLEIYRIKKLKHFQLQTTDTVRLVGSPDGLQALFDDGMGIQIGAVGVQGARRATVNEGLDNLWRLCGEAPI